MARWMEQEDGVRTACDALDELWRKTRKAQAPRCLVNEAHGGYPEALPFDLSVPHVESHFFELRHGRPSSRFDNMQATC